jgi:hypothetical protein
VSILVENYVVILLHVDLSAGMSAKCFGMRKMRRQTCKLIIRTINTPPSTPWLLNRSEFLNVKLDTQKIDEIQFPKIIILRITSIYITTEISNDTKQFPNYSM